VRTLYIHIGQPKTGSSSIQRFLVDNRAALLDAGLGLGPYMTLASGKSLPLRRAIAAKGLPAVMAELAASPGESLAISSEHLASIMVDEAAATALRDAARRHFRPVVVVFLRRQDHWLESDYAQEVKTRLAGPIEAYAAALAGDAGLDYDAGLARLERLFGRDGLRVLVYRDDGPNEVVAGFLAAIGLDPGLAAGAAAGRLNASPHRRKLLFLSQVPKPDPTIQDLATFMAGVVERTAAIADDGGRFLLSPRDRHRLVARHAAGNRALVARHGLADAGHFAALPDPAADWSPPRPITPAERRAVLGEAMLACARMARHRHPRFVLRMTGKVASLYARMRPPPQGR
jgi:hypothetical protein